MHWYTELNPVVWDRERTVPTERPPLVGDVSANFCRYSVPRGQHDGSLRPYSLMYAAEICTFLNTFVSLCSGVDGAIHCPFVSSGSKLGVSKYVIHAISETVVYFSSISTHYLKCSMEGVNGGGLLDNSQLLPWNMDCIVSSENFMNCRLCIIYVYETVMIAW
jgi:hypothetical protein